MSYSHDYQVQRFARGFEDALRYFFDLLYASLVHFALQITGNRQESEDIASGAFAKTWQHRARITSYPGLRAYLYKIVVRDSRLYLRNQKSRSRKEAASAIEDSDRELFERIVRSETYRLLHQAIREMPEGCREVMERYYIRGMNTREIAEDLGLRISTVKTQKLRGVERLRRTLRGLMPT